MTVSLTIVEGAAGPPPDTSKIVATIGWAPQMATSAAQIGSTSGLREAVGYGLGVEAVARRVRISKNRQVLCGHNPSVAGVISSVAQTGLGPAVSVVADDSHPLDDADVIVRISSSGAPGVAKYQVSYSSNVLGQGNIEPLYGSVLTMPARLPATIIGAVDLTTVTYAKPAIVTGTADLSDPTLYGAGGSLAGKTVIVDVDGAGAVTYTIPSGASAPANADALVALLTANFPGMTASYTNFPYLYLVGTDLGTTGELDITGGTGLALLGLTVATTNGTAGALDGKTVIYEADTGGSHTVTFGTGTTAPVSAADVIAAITLNVAADLYSAQSLLRIVSDTLGSTSTLAITGGNALALLGLTASVSPAEGAEPTHSIPHLGITLTFAAGTYRSGTTYAFTTKAPRPDVAEVEAQLRYLDGAGIDFGPVHIAAPLDVSTALAMGAMLDALGAEWEARTGNPRAAHFVVGVDIDELDSVVKATLAGGSFRTRRVDYAARGAYCTAGLIPGGGRLLRSQSWPCADADALLDFYRDRGERRLLIGGFPEVLAITDDENTATVKLVNATGPRFNVMTYARPGFQFVGGYSFADASSAFTDSSVRNTTHEAFLAAYPELARNENRTDLDTESDGTLAQASADPIAAEIAEAVADRIVPGGASAVEASVDTASDFYTTRRLAASIKFQNRVPAREIVATIGPGLITEG